MRGTCTSLIRATALDHSPEPHETHFRDRRDRSVYLYIALTSLLLPTGLDQYGEPVHPSMYNDLWINNPHCSNEYPDYTYEQHFGKTLPAFVPRAVVRDYLEGRLHALKNSLPCHNNITYEGLCYSR